MTAQLYCEKCGGKLGAVLNWPVLCSQCGKKSYKNPIPVAVALVPTQNPAGLIAIRRGVGPGAGALALPGGYVDWNDSSWQAAAARELHEEIGLVVDADAIQLFDVVSAPDKTLLIIALCPVVDWHTAAVQTTGEATEIAIVEQPIELAFPIHTQIVQKYFSQAYNGHLR